MEPRIATLLDQQPYRRLTLDPSVLTTPSSSAPRCIEPTSGVRAGQGHSQSDSHGDHDHVDTRHKSSSQAHSGAPLARVLNDPASSSLAFQQNSGRTTPQNVPYLTRNDVPISGALATSPDAPRRDESSINSIGHLGGDVSLIQLPKPPQAPRKTAKRPRIPPLLQGLHQPPPLPPKNKLFPPISERSRPGSDVSDRFGLTSAFPASSTEKSAKARAPLEKKTQAAIAEVEQTDILSEGQRAPREHSSNENTPDPAPAPQTTDRLPTKAKTTRKRTKWSQKETEYLLTGVSRYGIGRWKRILECDDFTFHGRTAVDLKDRFRVCRPGEGLKARKSTTESVPTIPRSADAGFTPIKVPSSSAKAASTELSESVHKPSAEGKATDIAAISQPDDEYGPFPKSNRRERRQFSDEDDRNLLKGFKRYGTRWRAMRDDLELGFDMRHPTDLRDRFRIRYPEEFARAGFKLKAKEARELGELERAKIQKTQISGLPMPTTGRTSDSSVQPVARANVITGSVAAPGSASKASNPTTLRPTFDLVTDLTFDDDEEGDDGHRSPIVLNRNILQWADENSTSNLTTTTAPISNQIPSLPPSDFLFNPFAVASDGLHINPLATLKLPSTAHWSYMNPPSTASALPPSLPPLAPLKHAVPANNTSASIVRAQQEMRTPNLPNIVFPYVPDASARNAVHNLPAPADILSERQSGTGDGFAGWTG